MPKNHGKGGKNRRKGKNAGDGERELLFKEDGQAYGQVTKMLGNGRVELICDDDKKRIGHIRGTMTRRVWVAVGDILLLGLRSFQDDKCDIIHKYNYDEARTLKSYGELGNSFTVGDYSGEPADDDIIMEHESDKEQEPENEQEKEESSDELETL